MLFVANLWVYAMALEPFLGQGTPVISKRVSRAALPCEASSQAAPPHPNHNFEIGLLPCPAINSDQWLVRTILEQDWCYDLLQSGFGIPEFF
jgi:hypothetical protein